MGTYTIRVRTALETLTRDEKQHRRGAYMGSAPVIRISPRRAADAMNGVRQRILALGICIFAAIACPDPPPLPSDRIELWGTGERLTTTRKSGVETFDYRFHAVIIENAFLLRIESGGGVEVIGKDPTGSAIYCASVTVRPPLHRGARMEDGVEFGDLELVPHAHLSVLSRMAGMRFEEGQPEGTYAWKMAPGREPYRLFARFDAGHLVEYRQAIVIDKIPYPEYEVSREGTDDRSEVPLRYATTTWAPSRERGKGEPWKTVNISIEESRVVGPDERFDDFLADFLKDTKCLKVGEHIDYATGTVRHAPSGSAQVSQTVDQLIAEANRQKLDAGRPEIANPPIEKAHAGLRTALVLGGILLLLAAAAMKLRGWNR